MQQTILHVAGSKMLWLLLLLCSSLPRRSDYEVGEELLRKYVFIHLSEPADKLQLMLAMLHKLYALVSGIKA